MTQHNANQTPAEETLDDTPKASAFHPQSTLDSQDERDEYHAYRPPSPAVYGLFLAGLVVAGLLLTLWGITPGIHFFPQ